MLCSEHRESDSGKMGDWRRWLTSPHIDNNLTAIYGQKCFCGSSRTQVGGGETPMRLEIEDSHCGGRPCPRGRLPDTVLAADWKQRRPPVDLFPACPHRTCKGPHPPVPSFRPTELSPNSGPETALQLGSLLLLYWGTRGSPAHPGVQWEDTQESGRGHTHPQPW